MISFKRFWIYFTGSLFFLILASVLFLKYYSYKNSKVQKAFIEYNHNRIEVDVARSLQEKQKGLSGKKVIERGLLFLYSQEDYYSIWMKEVFEPLRIIWINKNKICDIKIASVEDDPFNPKNIYKPSCKANYILELPLNQGKDLKIGQKIKINIINP